MYVVTFYSFKGGVGRSMALMNCAAKLVQEKKSVLVVDFDLEAPGLDTFKLNKPRRKLKGIVDYITDYLNYDIAPDIEPYIYASSFKDDSECLRFMPAGRRDVDYHKRLNSINWRTLYEKRDGYFLFENLKAQWAKSNLDYVLIDSRTGHTDIGSICTRQLPDAVVILFFPNEQNLLGLSPVVKRIKERNKWGKSPPQLHFVISNVPDIDDEHRFLAKRLEEFRKKLNYDQAAELKIHHYPSLSLLNQEIFSITRPNSRLASEYGNLVKEIQMANFHDRVGALNYLQEADEMPKKETLKRKKRMHIYRELRDIYGTDEKIDEFIAHHNRDPEVVGYAVKLMERRGRINEAGLLLERASSVGLKNPALLLRKAYINTKPTKEQVKEIVDEIKDMEGLSLHELVGTVRVLKDLYPEILNSIDSWKSIDKLDLKDVYELSKILSFDRKCLDKAEILIRKVGQQFETNKKEYILLERMLLINLIGQRKFDEAVQLAENILSKVRYETVAFHLAMAKWGLSREISIDDFEVAVAIKPIELLQEPQFFQTMSLIYWVLGDKKCSLDWLQRAEERVGNVPLNNFSSWTYLFSEPQKFQRDLKEQETMIDGRNILPRVFDLKKEENKIEFHDVNWLPEALKQLEHINQVAIEENYPKIDSKFITLARNILKKMSYFPIDPEVYPSMYGGISIYFKSNTKPAAILLRVVNDKCVVCHSSIDDESGEKIYSETTTIPDEYLKNKFQALL